MSKTKTTRRLGLAARLRGGSLGGWRYRAADLVSLRLDDWPSALMIATGSDFCGNWSAPEPQTWWYQAVPTYSRRRITNYPFRRFEIIKGDFAAYRAATNGLNEDQMDRWSAIGVDQDGELHIGRRYWGRPFYSLPADEWPILLRWMIRWQFANWFGLRTRIYEIGLHCKVHRRRWGCCNETPALMSGGYSHWHCQKRKGHAAPHRFNRMEWSDGGKVVAVDAAEATS